jgi:uncharacterized damage-inducible protein DinB
MMLPDIIRSLYQYSRWANHRILGAASGLTDEQFVALVEAHDRSLRDTLVHSMSAEWIWLARWQGASPKAMLDPLDFPDLQSIQTRWRAIEADTQQFIDQLNLPQLVKVISYTNTKGEEWAYPLWQQMVHQVNHATQHRSEVAAMLTYWGNSPGDLDYLVYLDQINV